MEALRDCKTNEELNAVIDRLNLKFIPKLTQVFKGRATVYFEPLFDGDNVDGVSLSKSILPQANINPWCWWCWWCI